MKYETPKANPNPETPQEAHYDQHIAPLVTQILNYCQEAGIPCLLDFNLYPTTLRDLRVTTLLPVIIDGTLKNDDLQLQAAEIVAPHLFKKHPTLHMTIDHGDGHQEMIAVVG